STRPNSARRHGGSRGNSWCVHRAARSGCAVSGPGRRAGAGARATGDGAGRESSHDGRELRGGDEPDDEDGDPGHQRDDRGTAAAAVDPDRGARRRNRVPAQLPARLSAGAVRAGVRRHADALPDGRRARRAPDVLRVTARRQDDGAPTTAAVGGRAPVQGSPAAVRRVLPRRAGPRGPALLPVWNFVRRSFYQDSVTLMRLTRDLEAVAGVRRAAAMMGTPPNRTL